jgi:hypothetical protein
MYLLHFRDDDLADTVVIDKINIFRADRVFKVFCCHMFDAYAISGFINCKLEHFPELFYF